MQGPISIFYFIILIASIIVHEVAHGIAAEQEGDPTARLQGRITLNPLKHLDLLGSVLLPLVLILTNAGVVLGWAKPVPSDPENLRNGNKKLVAKVAIAGIAVNLCIAVIIGLFIRGMVAFGLHTVAFIDVASILCLNEYCPCASLMPSRLRRSTAFGFYRRCFQIRHNQRCASLNNTACHFCLLFIVFGWKVVAPFAFTLFSFITGIAL